MCSVRFFGYKVCAVHFLIRKFCSVRFLTLQKSVVCAFDILHKVKGITKYQKADYRLL
jgi:hypothetical protein